MQKIGLGVKGLITLGDKFLVLVKKNGELDMPGGRVENWESITDGLHREIQEETRLKVDIVEPIFSWSFEKNPNLFVTGKTYLCNWIGGKVHLSDEHIFYFWSVLENKQSIIEKIYADMICKRKGDYYGL
jgi:8-oxo-dGTP diphosphatase